MPRPLRNQVPDGLYHITAHSNQGRVLFRDDTEREHFLWLLGRVATDRRWSCRAYCLLTTHYHLLAATPEADLAAGIQYLNGRYAQWANGVRGEKGHLFEARYHAVLVTQDGHRAELHRYIAMNPVRASVVPRPEEWPWSSYRALLGLAPSPSFLDARHTLLEFGRTPDEGRLRLQAFVDDSHASVRKPDLSPYA